MQVYKQIYKNENGFALPLTLVIVLALTLIGMTLFLFNMTETTQVTRDDNKMKAHYIARSGAHAAALKLLENQDLDQDLVDSPSSEPVDFADGQFVITVSELSDKGIIIKSTGTYRQVEQTVQIIVADKGIDFTLYGNKIEVDGGAGTISGGDVVYRDSSIMDEEAILDEDAEAIKLDRSFDSVVPPCDDEGSDFYGECPLDLSDPFEGEKITEHSQYKEIVLGGQINELRIVPDSEDDLLLKAEQIDLKNDDMIIDLGKKENNTVAVVVDDFRSTGNSEIYIKGRGALMFYVKNYTGGGTFQHDSDADVNVNILVMEGGEFDLGGTPNFEGSIYGPDADTLLFGNSSLTGWIIADNFEGDGNLELNYSPIEMANTGLDLTFYRMEKWDYGD